MVFAVKQKNYLNASNFQKHQSSSPQITIKLT